MRILFMSIAAVLSFACASQGDEPSKTSLKYIGLTQGLGLKVGVANPWVSNSSIETEHFDTFLSGKSSNDVSYTRNVEGYGLGMYFYTKALYDGFFWGPFWGIAHTYSSDNYQGTPPSQDQLLGLRAAYRWIYPNSGLSLAVGINLYGTRNEGATFGNGHVEAGFTL